MNYVFISPNFPKIYSHFVKSLKDKGVKVFGIGDEPYSNLNDELKENLEEYCFVSDLGNLQYMKDTMSYLRNKYGEIDYIESNNEYWLYSDSLLREYCGCKNGFLPYEMDKIKYKSKMKEYFSKAGAKVARYTLSSSFEKAKEFASIVGYPLFAKPDNGVGASSTYKIENEADLRRFYSEKDNETYIIEEYLDGYIISYDGICDDESNVVVSFNEVFPRPIADVVNENTDIYYYVKADVRESLEKLGRSVVKSFGVKKRCFHIEFFVLNEDKAGLGEKGDIVALEVNMRSPGGNTPDLLCLALNGSYYDIYAEVIANNYCDTSAFANRKVAISVNKKNDFIYVHTHKEIVNKYGSNIKEHGFYNVEIRDALGDEFYFAQFENEEEALAFTKFVQEKR
ncbi:MAG: ATP-grasp domain-containing protein [Bacilli bacterium]|nr:ATP-grasp domain-containing protein [Bacilli bacterium]